MSQELYNVLRGLSKDQILKLSLQPGYHGRNLFAHPTLLKKHLDIKERVGYLDIECTNLNASFGRIMSYCIKVDETGEVIKNVVTQKEVLSKEKDKRITKDLCDDMRKFDRVVTYYGSKFDIPFIRARSLKWGQDFPLYKEVKHTDVYYIVKHKLKLARSSLQTACEFFDIPSKGHRLNPEVWDNAITGDPEALKFVLQHNIEDVDSLQLLFKRLDGHYQINNRSV